MAKMTRIFRMSTALAVLSSGVMSSIAVKHESQGEFTSSILHLLELAGL